MSDASLASRPARPTTTRDRVARLLDRGLPQAAIARELGLSKATVAYHARKLGVAVNERCNRRYDWGEVQRFYDRGHSISECQAHFGFSRKRWGDAQKRGDVRARPRAMSIERLLAGPRNRQHVKQRLLKLGLKTPRCEHCGLMEWRGKPLSLALHHINGDRHDNCLGNLELLCPNCHSQTDNFSGKNIRRLSAREALGTE